MTGEWQGDAVDPFGAMDQIAVQRGLGEFRGGRPIQVTAGAERLIVLPLDGTTAAIYAAFQAACGPASPWLAITPRRARVLGFEAQGPLLVALSADEPLQSIWALATSIEGATARERRFGNRAAAAGIALAKLAQRLPALLVADAAAAPALARDPRLISVDADAVGRFRENLVGSVALAGKAQVPLRDGVSATFHVFRDSGGGSSTAIVIGAPDFSRPVTVRLHSACLTGDVFGSRRCDCGAQLQLAIRRLSEGEGGVILYLEQEGRGLGLANKMRAYALQDEGLDTVDANTALGFDDDERDYGIAARMLQILGCRRVVLMTNNPDKLEGLSEAGVEIAGRVPLYTPINADNRRYLAAKATRAGHWLDLALAPAGDDSQQMEPDSRG